MWESTLQYLTNKNNSDEEDTKLRQMVTHFAKRVGGEKVSFPAITQNENQPNGPAPPSFLFEPNQFHSFSSTPTIDPMIFQQQSNDQLQYLTQQNQILTQQIQTLIRELEYKKETTVCKNILI